jgi:hypothetical protein
MRSLAEGKTVERVLDAVSRLDLTAHPQWGEVRSLSDRTTLDGVEVDPEAIVVRGEGFEADMTVYLALTYDRANKDPIETSDAMIGWLKGHFTGAGEPVIDEVGFDPSSVMT